MKPRRVAGCVGGAENFISLFDQNKCESSPRPDPLSALVVLSFFAIILMQQEGETKGEQMRMSGLVKHQPDCKLLLT